MAILKRKIIRIDEEKCDGCGLCIPSCPEGALAIIDGKARVVRDDFCDGLGACMGDCPLDALHIVEEIVEEYNEKKVLDHLRETAPELVEKHRQHLKQHGMSSTPEPTPAVACGGCSSAATRQWEEPESVLVATSHQDSTLRQWPVQLHLLSPQSPFFHNADLVLVADCVPLAYGNFHQDFLQDNAIAICCPKLDDTNGYVEKIAGIIATASPRSITVLYMEVPCCGGLVQMAKQSLAMACNIGNDTAVIPFHTVRIGIKGEVQARA